MELQISKPLTLKCGLTLPNRLGKAAMAERLADRKALPRDKDLLGAYESWSRDGWGLVITGNVDVDPAYIGTAGDVVVDPAVPRETTLAAWKTWAQTALQNNTPVVVQLNHPGRQTQMKTGIAPSPIAMDFGSGLLARAANAIVFGTPREMTVSDIQRVIQQFAAAARLAADAGFAGVELHGAHGYLITQFLSPDSNHRTDKYGGDARARATFVVELVAAIRAVVPAHFCLGIKLNSVDHRSPGAMADCVTQLHAIADPVAGVDFVEISGGTFENPEFVAGAAAAAAPSARTQAREAFFLDFASAIRAEFPQLPLMVTGGFRSRRGMEAAVAGGHCDLVGIARPAALQALAPRDVLLNAGVLEERAVVRAVSVKMPTLAKILGLKIIGAGAESAWYADRIRDKGKAAEKGIQ